MNPTSTDGKGDGLLARPIPNAWGGDLDAAQSLGPRLRAVKWNVQGQSTAPDNLFDWLLATNRYPQHRGRAAALQFISEQARQLAEVRGALVRTRNVLRRYRTETPLGHQPHMIAHLADSAIEEAGKALSALPTPEKVSE